MWRQRYLKYEYNSDIASNELFWCPGRRLVDVDDLYPVQWDLLFGGADLEAAAGLGD